MNKLIDILLDITLMVSSSN